MAGVRACLLIRKHIFAAQCVVPLAIVVHSESRRCSSVLSACNNANIANSGEEWLTILRSAEMEMEIVTHFKYVETSIEE